MHAKLSIKPTPDIDYVIYTDASESGWGAHDDINSIGRWWSDDEIHYHINVLELLAIELALKAFLKDFNKKHVRIFSDNTTAVTYINKQGSIKSLSYNEIAKKIWEFCIHNNTHISAAHIPGKHNILADLASRKFQDSAEWMLEPKIFDYVIRQFGRPEINMFASRLAKQIPVYASWLPDPESSFIDAFTINWNNIFIYAFPPFSIIWRMLQKIQEECKKAIVIVPLWTTQSWFTRIMELAISQPIIIPSRYLKLPGTKAKHTLYPKLQMLALLILIQFHLQHQFRQMHKQLYQQHGETLPKQNTTVHSKDGQTFVVKGISIHCNQIQ